MKRLFRKKSIVSSIEVTKVEGQDLKRTLNAWNLALMGVAVAIGAGIFSMAAEQAANVAGPAVVISFLIAAVVCALAVMCYAEFASAIPVAGTAYTFSYITFGELIAWVIGWDMILEAALTSALIAKYWTVYVAQLFNFNLSKFSIIAGPIEIDIFTFAIICVMTFLLVKGTKLSVRFSNVITVIKIAVILFLIILGSFSIKASNFSPFIPPSVKSDVTGSSSDVLQQQFLPWLFHFHPSVFGVSGILIAAATLFFAFGGFDMVASSAEETKNPQKDLPKGLFLGLGITSLLYVGVSLVATGAVKYTQLSQYAKDTGNSANLAMIFDILNKPWAAKVIAIGAILGLTTVVMTCMFALSRIIFSISRDGLLPKGLSKTSDVNKTPANTQIIVGLVVAIIASISTAQELAGMVNIGILSSFAIVSFAIPTLRKRPDFNGKFRVPLNPVLPIISGLACVYLILNLENLTLLRFLVWLIIGFVIYFAYSRKRANIVEDKTSKIDR